MTQLLAEASQRIQPTVGELFQALKVRLWLLGLGAWGSAVGVGGTVRTQQQQLSWCPLAPMLPAALSPVASECPACAGPTGRQQPQPCGQGAGAAGGAGAGHGATL